MKTDHLPLKLADKIIGYIDIDYSDGVVSGVLDKEFVSILEEGFGAGLLEVSFFGKPSLPVSVAQKIFNDYIQEVEPGASCRIPGHRQRVNNDGRTFHCLDCEQIIVY